MMDKQAYEQNPFNANKEYIRTEKENRQLKTCKSVRISREIFSKLWYFILLHISYEDRKRRQYNFMKTAVQPTNVTECFSVS